MGRESKGPMNRLMWKKRIGHESRVVGVRAKSEKSLGRIAGPVHSALGKILRVINISVVGVWHTLLGILSAQLCLPLPICLERRRCEAVLCTTVCYR